MPFQASERLFGDNDGGGGIRTHDTFVTYTRFPSVLLRPLGHSSTT